MASKVYFEELRTLASGGISAAYASVGVPTANPIRIFCISNNTQGDMLFTTDTSRDEMFVPAGTFRLYDLQSNINPQFDDKYVLQIGTQFSVKQLTAPVAGSVYIECLH